MQARRLGLNLLAKKKTFQTSFLTIKIDIKKTKQIYLLNIPFACDLKRTVIPI